MVKQCGGSLGNEKAISGLTFGLRWLCSEQSVKQPHHWHELAAHLVFNKPLQTSSLFSLFLIIECISNLCVCHSVVGGKSKRGKM